MGIIKHCIECGRFIGKKEHKCSEVNPMEGRKHTEETKRKISNSRTKGIKEGRIKNPMKGKKLTEETKRIIRESRLRNIKEGKIKIWNAGLTKETDERVKRIAEKMFGRVFTEEHKKKLSLSMLGKSLTEEHKRKIGLANLGKNNSPKTEECKRKLSLAHKGMKYSEEAKQKMKKNSAKYWLGKKRPPFSEEWIKKMRLSRLKENNPNWRGGKMFEPYTSDFNATFKELIRQRDNLSCLKCNLFQDDSLKLYRRKLIVHHIDYIKENTFKENCCALCIKCNAEVNFNRHHWTKFFQSLLSERYGYQYSEISLYERETPRSLEVG